MSTELSSSTLVELYMQQGHVKRAGALVEELLNREPYNGFALVLRERLCQHNQPVPSLSLSHERGKLSVRWAHLPKGFSLQLTLTTFRELGENVHAHSNIQMCESTGCTLYLPAEPGPCAAAACLSYLDPHAGSIPIAIATPIHWA